MEMGNGNRNIGTCFTFGLVIRGELDEIQELIEYLKESDLTIAHQEIGQTRMYIRKEEKSNGY